VANYAEGLSATLDGKFELATAPLDAALEQARKSGWLDLATHAGTELAAAWVRLGDDDQANSALARVAGLCDADTPSGVLRRWRDCMTTRLSEASAAVRAPAERAFERLAGPGSAVAGGGAGGAGGAGQDAGADEQISDVGKFLRKAGKSKTFVSAKCTSSGFAIDWEATPDARVTRPFDDGLRYANAGGVTLAFSGRSVALRMVDLRGLDGQPGESSESSTVRALYLLAEGETWSVSKDGVVKIGK
jgi:hypothetical protein